VPRPTGVSPVLLVADLERSLEYFRDKLGFEAEDYGDPPDFAAVRRDDAAQGSTTRSTTPRTGAASSECRIRTATTSRSGSR
jgi:catechol 2,3-dioxygenase-like lactoylglutathione lyase family enzyme